MGPKRFLMRLARWLRACFVMSNWRSSWLRTLGWTILLSSLGLLLASLTLGLGYAHADGLGSAIENRGNLPRRQTKSAQHGRRFSQSLPLDHLVGHEVNENRNAAVERVQDLGQLFCHHSILQVCDLVRLDHR